MKVTTVKGTNDYRPEEVRLRDYLQGTILDVYTRNGFEHITTPMIEDIENLDKSEGGENLNLIFKILKRGDKLSKAIAAGDTDGLSDMGLRYDLTLPLSRYYANNRAKLVLPFKTIQVDRVYRAERPQKGRLREFVQCDIDILGSDSMNCELELIDTTAKALLAIQIGEFRVKVNDRRILKAILSHMGFADKELDRVCIIFDKMDKIGCEGVENELNMTGFSAEAIRSFVEFLSKGQFTLSSLRSLLPIDNHNYIDQIESLIQSANELAEGKYEVVFDVSLVRGQGYYTGTIFEVESTKFRGAIAGGGRYDHLIGKFVNEDIPAVGFSIGFERIYSILNENGFVAQESRKRIALFYMPDQFIEATKKANELRNEYDVTLYEKPKKLGKFLNRLEEQNINGFIVFGESDDIKLMEA